MWVVYINLKSFYYTQEETNLLASYMNLNHRQLLLMVNTSYTAYSYQEFIIYYI